VLHRKLQESTPEPERLEDALTSTVFGLLVCLDAWDVLAQWLGLTRLLKPYEPVQGDCWFWPRMAYAVPDVVLQLNDILVVVEAKLGSGRSDLAVEGAEEVHAARVDQLVRQYECIAVPRAERSPYVEPLERAISDRRCLVQVFVVDGTKRWARDEFVESKGRLPADADLRLVTWQTLYRILSHMPQARWTRDLRTFLERLSLDTFQGIGHNIPVTEAQNTRRWSLERPPLKLRELPRASVDLLALLRRWRAPSAEHQRQRVFAIRSFPLDPVAATVLYGWGLPSKEK
jgi:hypothetical protein